MKDIQYFGILKSAFAITWKNKFLWFFGFLILLGSIGFNFKSGGSNAIDQKNGLQDFSILIQNNPKTFILLSVILIAVMIALFLLRIVATAGLIKSVNDINLYRQMSILAILKDSKKYLWRLLLLEVVVGAVLGAIVFVLVVPVWYLFSLDAKVVAFFIAISAVLIVTAIIILAYYILRYAGYYIILADEKLRASLDSAYALFVKNIKESLLMTLVTIVSGFVFAMITLFATFLLAIPLALIGILVYLVFAKIGVIIFSGIAVLFCLIALLVLISWYMAFLQTAWFLFFQQISFEKHKEKNIVENVEVKGEVPSPEVV